ncbi:MAG TPA: bis(5'-nucleosyl)-tetraphosphatase (symmetrical) YqeK [Haloplasmataceae bacterium]
MITVLEALEIIKKRDELRFLHIYGTYETALKLANLYQLDKYKISLGAILHDYAKNMPIDEQKEIINKYLDKSILDYDSAVFHGEVGSFLIQKDLGVNDQDIIQAVKYHVTGHPEMNDYAKVIYIADFTEMNRTHKGVDFCRKLSEITLDLGVLAVSEKTYQYLINSKKNAIHPLTYATYQSFLKKVGVDYYESLKSCYESL